jgi:hypothetical protein
MNSHSIRDLQEVEFSDTFDIQRLIDRCRMLRQMTRLDVENPLLSEQNKLFPQWYVGRFSTKPRVTVPQALRWKTSLPWEEIDEA